MKERKILSCCNNEFALHIESVNLAEGDYELVPLDSITMESVDLNCTNVNQDLGQAPEDSQFGSAQEGKPRCIAHYFLR